MNWINVNDKLPETQELVVLLRGDHIIKVIGFGYKDSHLPQSHLWVDITRRDHDGDFLCVFDVTHWYPIPRLKNERIRSAGLLRRLDTS